MKYQYGIKTKEGCYILGRWWDNLTDPIRITVTKPGFKIIGNLEIQREPDDPVAEMIVTECGLSVLRDIGGIIGVSYTGDGLETLDDTDFYLTCFNLNKNNPIHDIPEDLLYNEWTKVLLNNDAGHCIDRRKYVREMTEGKSEQLFRYEYGYFLIQRNDVGWTGCAYDNDSNIRIMRSFGSHLRIDEVAYEMSNKDPVEPIDLKGFRMEAFSVADSSAEIKLTLDRILTIARDARLYFKLLIGLIVICCIVGLVIVNGF